MDALSACTRLAARQYGAIGRAQALGAGLSTDSIDRLMRAGAWTKLHRGVYALWVPDETWPQRLMAGCLWLGAGSAVSHRAAATLLALDGFEAVPLEFSTTGRCRISDGPLVVHRVRRLPDCDVDVRENIPVTSATGTLIDLGAVADPRAIELALESALRKGLTSSSRLMQRLGKLSPRTPHVSALRQLLNQGPIVATESALETLVWRLLLEHGLRPPERQHEISRPDGSFVARVDFAYPHEKVAIEADGYRFHSTPEDWHRDRRRDSALTALSWTVYRVTWVDVSSRGRTVVREIAGLLAHRAGSEISTSQSSRSTAHVTRRPRPARLTGREST